MQEPEKTKVEGSTTNSEDKDAPAPVTEAISIPDSAVRSFVPTIEEIEHQEHILTREQVIVELDRHVGNYAITKELSDKKGLYYLEVTIQGENAEEMTEYAYRRKGKFKQFQAIVTTIESTEDSFPIGGQGIVNFDEGKREWVEPKDWKPQSNEGIRV